jgi:hypothetical protein
MRTRHVIAIVLLTLLPLVVGCSSSHIVTTWRDPQFQGPINFKKTAILVLHPDDAVRRAAEDEIVKQIGPHRAVAGYTFLSDEDRGSVDRVKAKIESIGADGAITLKLLNARQESTYVPGSTGYGPYLYDAYGRDRYMASPGYVVTDTIASIQTTIYDVKTGKPIWMGTSDTFNPSNARTVVREIAKAVGKELRKEKLIVD